MAELRRKVQLQKPNPLFEGWLQEWLQEAKRIESSELVTKFENALTSLKKYPLVLCSGKECLILEHFDASMCIKLDRKLVEHRKSATGNNCDSQTLTAAGTTTLPSTDKSPSAKNAPVHKTLTKKKKKAYLPKYRSAAFALLVALYKKGDGQGMHKTDLQKASQPFCDASKGQAGSSYTGWFSMSQLISKNLVIKCSNPPRYKLSSEGMELASRLLHLHPCDTIVEEQPLVPLTAQDILAPGKPRSKQAKLAASNSPPATSYPGPNESEAPCYLLPNSFDIILLVDTAETLGAQKVKQDETLRHLGRHSVVFEVRKLKIGDFLWVARHRETSFELVLPYILERKRLDDFAKSIKDGRFSEQKFRLKSCGLSKVIYLIEGMGSRAYYGLPMSTLMQASANTQITDGFSVKMTANHSETMNYIANLTKLFIQLYKDKTLFPLLSDDDLPKVDLNDFIVALYSFNGFCHNKGKSRKFEQREIFLKSLVQLHGISAEKALVIAENYRSPYVLRKAFLSSDEMLLADLTFGTTGQRIGPSISKTLYHFYTLPNFPE